MWVSLVVKMTLLLVTAVSVHVSLSPPNPPVKSEECCSGTKETDTIFEKFVQSITYCSKCMVWFGTLCECLATLVYVVSSSYQFLFFNDNLSTKNSFNVSVHPAMIVGAFTTLVAAVLRIWCFKCLGPFFTFEITIRPQHLLITHGPYAWVRHPSYTGVYLTLSGATLVLGSPGTWVTVCGVRSVLGVMMAGVWLMKCAFAFRGMCVRLRAEDEILRGTFGAEWEAYASRVPFKFLPGVV